MIIAHVRFPVHTADRAALQAQLLATTHKYEKLAGLIRKYYLMTEAGTHAGGIYIWESKAHAQAWYTAQWERDMTAAWGAAPLLEYLECPIVVDAARVTTPP